MTSERVCWFVARTRRGQELSLRKRMGELGVECFIPTVYAFRERRGRRVRVEVPLIPNLVFLKATKDEACALANGRGLPLFYIIDHQTHTLLEVPLKQMEDFRRAVEADPDSLSTEIPLTLGGKVRIIAGELAGVEGEILSLPAGSFVVVSVGHILCAKVSIPRDMLETVAD